MVKHKEIKKINRSKILVAVSGGSDSMALLHILYELNYDVFACYIDHKQRPKENIVEKKIINIFCQERKIDFFVGVIDKPIPKTNLQDFFRKERYNLLANKAIDLNIKYIALAHHKDDQLETIFMREIKNPLSNKNYLMKDIRKYNEKLYLLRPLLEYDKKTILFYCKFNNIPFFNDSSNYKNVYLRNKIRNDILPYFQKINNKFSENYLKLYHSRIEYISSLSKYITKDLKKIFSNGYIETVKLKYYLCNKSYLIKILTIEILFDYYFNLHIKNKNSRLIIDILDCFDIKKKYSIQLTKSIFLNIQYGKMYIIKNNDNFIYDNKVSKKISFKKIEFYSFKLYLSNTINNINCKDIHFIKFPYSFIKEDLIVKFPQKEDFLYLKNGRKKINRLYIDKKILPHRRYKTPVISTKKNSNVILYDILTKTCSFNTKKMEEKFIYLFIEKIN